MNCTHMCYTHRNNLPSKCWILVPTPPNYAHSWIYDIGACGVINEKGGMQTAKKSTAWKEIVWLILFVLESQQSEQSSV